MRRLTSQSVKSRGFTLLELIITLGVFILLAAAVFGIISGVLKGSLILRDNQNRGDQIAAMNAFLQKKLGDLPAQSYLVSYRRGDGDGLIQNGILFGGNDGSIIIDAVPQANGYYTLRYGFIPLIGPRIGNPNAGFVPILPDMLVKRDDPTFAWMPLIHDVKSLHWKFQDVSGGLWADAWNNANAKPNVIEFTMQLAGDSQPATMDFWLPLLTPAPMASFQQTANHGP